MAETDPSQPRPARPSGPEVLLLILIILVVGILAWELLRAWRGPGAPRTMKGDMMEQWYSETVPVITFPDPDVATWYLHEFDEHMAAKGAPEEAWLLSPPCGHSDCLATWHTAGRLTLWCARCHARVLVAVQWGVVLQHEDEAEEATTICGHAPYAKVVYRAGYVRVYCGECQTRWSRWAVAPYVHEVPM